MRIALAGAKMRNNDVSFSLAQIRRFMQKARREGADLVCFGEAFLQGFDAFSWHYETDRTIALSAEDALFQELLAETAKQQIDLLFGFLERDGEALYSSCALMGGGKLLHLYRRVSVGWKEYTRTDAHYREGERVEPFLYRGKTCLIALCGDLWDVTAPQFQHKADLLFWPVYINFSLEEWLGAENERQQYAEQAQTICRDVLMINSMDDQPSGDSPALGGCYRFTDGKAADEWPLGSEGMLLVDI